MVEWLVWEWQTNKLVLPVLALMFVLIIILFLKFPLSFFLIPLYALMIWVRYQKYRRVVDGVQVQR
jgi:uncharacterized membrane protein AbrB (regulator of aidB expression)